MSTINFSSSLTTLFDICIQTIDANPVHRSSLAHDFYQVMVGNASMNLFGWKQLILWSLDHACLSDSERHKVRHQWELEWEKFLQWVVDKYWHAVPKV